MLFTETLKELLQELESVPHTIYWSHGNSLPSCFNVPLRKALKASHSHIWIVEDDMVLQKGILQDLIAADKDSIACDYPIIEQPSGTIMYDTQGQAIFTGTGCLLVKTPILRAMPDPVFRADISWEYKSQGGKLVFSAVERDPQRIYGQHDITFGLYHYVLGQPIAVHPTVLAQRKLRTKGTSSDNAGTDDIVLFDQFERKPLLIEPATDSNQLLVELEVAGQRISVSRDHADKLIAAGQARCPVLSAGDIVVDPAGSAKAKKLFKAQLTKQ